MSNLPTISIKGKDYVQVKDRVAFFNETYKNGAIHTSLISYEGKKVIVQATVIPDMASPERFFTGLSQADENQGMINATAALENCETSAVGRALGMMGIGIIESIASADEVSKAIVGQQNTPKTDPRVVSDEQVMDVMEAFELTQIGKPCPKCGATQIKYRTGKVGCSAFCWKK